MLIKNGTIYDAVNEKPYVADILINDGNIMLNTTKVLNVLIDGNIVL